MMKKNLLFLLITFGIAGCSTVSNTYLSADRATYQAVGPEYLNYVRSDSSLSESQKQIRIGTVESWQKRIDAALEVTP